MEHDATFESTHASAAPAIPPRPEWADWGATAAIIVGLLAIAIASLGLLRLARFTALPPEQRATMIAVMTSERSEQLAAAWRASQQDEQEGLPWRALAKLAGMPIAFLAWGLGSILSGIGLLQRRRWARHGLIWLCRAGLLYVGLLMGRASLNLFVGGGGEGPAFTLFLHPVPKLGMLMASTVLLLLAPYAVRRSEVRAYLEAPEPVVGLPAPWWPRN